VSKIIWLSFLVAMSHLFIIYEIQDGALSFQWTEDLPRKRN